MNETIFHNRTEARGPGWSETFVDTKRASNAISVGSSVSQSLSYITINNFATLDERSALIDSATDKKGEDDVCILNGGSSSNHILFASSANNNCNRYSVKALLNDAAKHASAALLNRLLEFLDGSGGDNIDDGVDPSLYLPLGGGERMLELAIEIFGTNTDLNSMECIWYNEPNELGQLHPEPKVNLYSSGGHFKQHEDGMGLTLLVVLSDDFEGGGTAFYRDLDRSHDDLDIEHQTNEDHSFLPESIALPQAGSAMIWGGSLQHSALQVTKGTRAVYVGSFDLK